MLHLLGLGPQQFQCPAPAARPGSSCVDTTPTSASVPRYLEAGVQLLVVAVRDVLPLGAGDRVVVLHHRHRLGQRPGQLRRRRQGQVPQHCQLGQGLQPRTGE